MHAYIDFRVVRGREFAIECVSEEYSATVCRMRRTVSCCLSRDVLSGYNSYRNHPYRIMSERADECWVTYAPTQ